MPLFGRETTCAICGADLEPDHFKQLHPQYAKFRRAFWTLLAIYLALLLAIPYGVARALSLTESLLNVIVLTYAFAGLVALLGPRLWLEKRGRDAWKRDHPISMSGLRVEIAFDQGGAESGSGLLTGTVTAKVKGTDGHTYLGVRLDHPFTIVGNSAQNEVMINELMVATRFRVQAPIDDIVQSKQSTNPVRILRPLVGLGSFDSLLDLSNAVSLGSGSIKRL